MRDRRLQRVYVMVRALVDLLAKATEEAESLSDQELAEDLHAVLWRLRKVLEGIGERGQRYRRL